MVKTLELAELEKVKTVKDNRLLAIMATVLLALMLISQLSLASDTSNNRILFDSDNYGSLENDVDNEPEKNINGYTPGLILNLVNVKQSLISLSANQNQTLAYINNLYYSFPIRSPPYLS